MFAGRYGPRDSSLGAPRFPNVSKSGLLVRFDDDGFGRGWTIELAHSAAHAARRKNGRWSIIGEGDGGWAYRTAIYTNRAWFAETSLTIGFIDDRESHPDYFGIQ